MIKRKVYFNFMFQNMKIQTATPKKKCSEKRKRKKKIGVCKV